VLIVLKSGSLNLLESSGPVKACNGIALPLAFTSCAACSNCCAAYNSSYEFSTSLEHYVLVRFGVYLAVVVKIACNLEFDTV
jgi:hypothetical protein